MELLNSKIGKYTLTKYIGEGGMASVYEGTHLFLGTKAAVKVLNPMLSKNDQFRQRFRNEAAFMASLDHPNITKVLDFEDSDEVLAIVMELLEGSDLSDLVKEKGALTFEEFKPLFIQILDAFKYAHNQGIVHRDIKPSNIFIDARGTVKILDFGIAKLFGQGNEMTQTGTQMGTPIYMSPEQVKGDKSIDHRSDIYSLGVTMYYALKGKTPYDQLIESQFDIFNKIVFAPLPDLYDDNYYSLIEKACQKDREQRFQSCEEWLTVFGNEIKQPMGEADQTNVIKPQPPELENSILEISPIIEVKQKTKAENFENGGYKSVNEKPKREKTKRIVLISIFSFVAIIGAILFMYLKGNEETFPQVTIGNQIWMSENLNVDHFRNGDLIGEAKTAEQWINAGKNKQPAWCYYNFDSKNGKKFGKLYNGFATKDPRGLAPDGWHVSSSSEWNQLIDYFGGKVNIVYKIKSISGWKNLMITTSCSNCSSFGNEPVNCPKCSGSGIFCDSTQSGNGIDETGFSAFPAGICDGNGKFEGLGFCTAWTDFGNTYSLSCYREYLDIDQLSSLSLTYGFSVRCLRDTQ